MNEEKTKRSTHNTLKQIATLIGLSLAFVSMVGCSEEIKEGLKDLGKPVAAEKIDEALNEAARGSSLQNAKTGQVVHYEQNYRVELNPVIRLADVIRTYLRQVETATSFQFFLNEDYFAYDNDGAVKEEKHSEVSYELKKIVEEAEMSFFAKKGEVCGETQEDTDGIKFNCIRYFNFSKKDKFEPAPAKAKLRANCGNIPDYHLPVTRISFDRVKLLDGKFMQKEVFDVEVAKSVPMLFPELGMPIYYFCLAKLYRSETSSFYVNRCTVLRDLQL